MVRLKGPGGGVEQTMLPRLGEPSQSSEEVEGEMVPHSFRGARGADEQPDVRAPFLTAQVDVVAILRGGEMMERAESLVPSCARGCLWGVVHSFAPRDGAVNVGRPVSRG